MSLGRQTLLKSGARRLRAIVVDYMVLFLLESGFMPAWFLLGYLFGARYFPTSLVFRFASAFVVAIIWPIVVVQCHDQQFLEYSSSAIPLAIVGLVFAGASRRSVPISVMLWICRFAIGLLMIKMVLPRDGISLILSYLLPLAIIPLIEIVLLYKNARVKRQLIRNRCKNYAFDSITQAREDWAVGTG